MLNLLKTKMFLMVLVAFASYMAYHMTTADSAKSSALPQNPKAVVSGDKTGNPLLDYDIATVKHWTHQDCFAALFGRGEQDEACIDLLTQHIKHDTDIDIRKDQILDKQVREILLKRYNGESR